MLLRRLILASLLIGVVTGALLSLGQQLRASQLIHAAEVYEVADHDHGEGHDHHSHGHDHGEHDHTWMPADGTERTFYTLVSDICAATGFAALMLVAMTVAAGYGQRRITPARGLLWGLVGFIAFFVAPGLGLPPELPGFKAAPLEARQLWWVLTVSLTLVAFALLFFARSWQKLGALPLLLIPHVWGAPQLNGPAIANPDPQAIAQLEQLHHSFIIATTLTNAGFWLLLGLGCAIAIQSWSKPHGALSAA
ncbi:CbtA family protein [Phytohalomonas tamaricis]|uniref:CbtA family protein n=1 Tax=Phytohalomonas tamaricis TaxID=2081032 RepID=UPI000D0B253B|nr:CbtA family protein [Phytohalomonas tamaricis]